MTSQPSYSPYRIQFPCGQSEHGIRVLVGHLFPWGWAVMTVTTNQLTCFSPGECCFWELACLESSATVFFVSNKAALKYSNNRLEKHWKELLIQGPYISLATNACGQELEGKYGQLLRMFQREFPKWESWRAAALRDILRRKVVWSNKHRQCCLR